MLSGIWSNDSSGHGWLEKDSCPQTSPEPINNVWRVTETLGEENPRRKTDHVLPIHSHGGGRSSHSNIKGNMALISSPR